jgi:alkylation response protein AidB-like acyl-CoA dehydrogenase
MPPLEDIKFTLFDIIRMDEVLSLDHFSDASEDLIDAVMEEGGKFAREILSPLNRIGDIEGTKFEDKSVIMPAGFKEAYAQYVINGWNSVSSSPEYGGMGLPVMLGVALMEMVDSANMAYSLCPILSCGAVDAIEAHGTEDQKATYLEKLVSGEWTGTMNLTESSAGSDVGALTTKAAVQADGSYLIKGQKIFITYGDHDMAENIIHLVLARLPDAPSGTKGISLFIVPKFLINEDGSLGRRNDAYPVSVEHKMGIMASPTCTMAFGDNDQCTGYLLHEENRGMQAMFTFMNNARLNIGVQGVACAERAYQMAHEYALERIQGKAIGYEGSEPPAIIEHADVRRMLLTMKSMTEAARAIAYLTSKSIDMSRHHPDEEVREEYRGLADLLTPMAKAYTTDVGSEVASLAVQVFGGAGYIEETGIAQIYRDARINQIYEGTNGIQAMDLAGRKLSLKGGKYWQEFLDKMLNFCENLPDEGDFILMKKQLGRILISTKKCSHWLYKKQASDLRSVMAGSVPFLRLFSTAVGSYLLIKGAMSARNKIKGSPEGNVFYDKKINIAYFYAQQIVPQVLGLEEMIISGDEAFFRNV